MGILTRINGYFWGNIVKVRTKPRTIQLPITSFCNSRCVTCNVWKLQERHNIDYDLLGEALQNSYFNKVESVGINGGEPSLHKNFLEVISIVLTLPRLKYIYIISNGMVEELLLHKLEKAIKLCRKRGVKLHLTISDRKSVV